MVVSDDNAFYGVFVLEASASPATPTAPSITTQPTNVEVAGGKAASFTVAASGYPTPGIQWYQCDDAEKTNANAISGATSATYNFTAPAYDEGGSNVYYYYAVASNTIDEVEQTATSNVATLTVTAAPTLVAVTSHLWDFNWGVSGDVKVTDLYDGNTIEVAATADKPANFTKNSKKFDDNSVSLDYYVKLAGTGDKDYQHVHFKVAGPSKVTIYAMSSNSSTARDITVYRGVWGENLTTITGGALGSGATGGLKSALYEYAGTEAADIYVALKGGGGYLYGLKVEVLEAGEESDLAVVSGKESIILASDGSYTLTKGVDYTTTSTGAITFTSSNTAAATVNETTGVITAVAAGTTTITLTQAADETYNSNQVTFSVTVQTARAKNAYFLTPADVLDLSNATAALTMLNKEWSTNADVPYYGNDGESNYLVFSPYSAYQSMSTQTWTTVPNNGDKVGGSSDISTWDAAGVFKGNTAYTYQESVDSKTGEVTKSGARYATTNATRSYTFYSYRVKGVSKVQLLTNTGSTDRKVYMGAYEITAGTAAASTLLFTNTTTKNVETLTLALDKSKEYLITLENDVAKSNNSQVYEMALYYDNAVTLAEPISTKAGKTLGTYVTANKLDFTSIPVAAAIKPYIATAVNNSKTSVTLTEKTTTPADAPILVETTEAGATVYVPITTGEVDDLDGNLLKKGPANLTGDGTEYILSDGLFYVANAGSLAEGKAYLKLPVAGARSLTISFDDDNETTGITSTALQPSTEQYFNLAGQHVAQPTKGLYIVNGKKVIIK